MSVRSSGFSLLVGLFSLWHWTGVQSKINQFPPSFLACRDNFPYFFLPPPVWPPHSPTWKWQCRQRGRSRAGEDSHLHFPLRPGTIFLKQTLVNGNPKTTHNKNLSKKIIEKSWAIFFHYFNLKIKFDPHLPGRIRLDAKWLCQRNLLEVITDHRGPW